MLHYSTLTHLACTYFIFRIPIYFARVQLILNWAKYLVNILSKQN